MIKTRHTRAPEAEDSWLSRNSNWLLFTFAFCSLSIVIFAVFWHFQLGKDIKYLAIQNSATAAYWGQIGDFIGGALNPILSFIALLAVLSNLVMQRKELSLARADARAAHEVQMEQRDIFERQNFESVLFQLLEAHSRIVSNLKITIDRRNHDAIVLRGREVFEGLIDNYVPLEDVNSGEFYDGEIPSMVAEAARIMMIDQGSPIGHYFRNLYQLLKYIDGYGQDPKDHFRRARSYSMANRAMRNYYRQRTYANMLRAQLSTHEVSCIFLNCLTKDGAGLKYYVEKFSLLKNLDTDQLGTDAVKLLYAKCAFQESEDINMRDIIEMTTKKYMSEVGRP